MTPVVTDRERWIALGLLGFALLLAYMLLVHPWWTVPMREADARIEQLHERDARLRAQVAQAPLVAQRLAQVQNQLASRPGFLPEATPELAIAGLVQRLETVVAQASPGYRSCAISNRSPLPERGNERYPRIAVQVRLRCGTPELAAVLHALEAGTPRLFVDNLNVLAQRFFFTGANDGASGNGGLDVSFDLVGYLRPQAEGIAPTGNLAPVALPAMPAPMAAPVQAPISAPMPSTTAPPAPVPTITDQVPPATVAPTPTGEIDGGSGAP